MLLQSAVCTANRSLLTEMGNVRRGRYQSSEHIFLLWKKSWARQCEWDKNSRRSELVFFCQKGYVIHHARPRTHQSSICAASKPYENHSKIVGSQSPNYLIAGCSVSVRQRNLSNLNQEWIDDEFLNEGRWLAVWRMVFSRTLNSFTLFLMTFRTYVISTKLMITSAFPVAEP